MYVWQALTSESREQVLNDAEPIRDELWRDVIVTDDPRRQSQTAGGRGGGGVERLNPRRKRTGSQREQLCYNCTSVTTIDIK